MDSRLFAPHVSALKALNAKGVFGLDQDPMICKVSDERTKTFQFYSGVNLTTNSSISPAGRSIRRFEGVDESGNKLHLKETRGIFADSYHKGGDFYGESKGIGRLIPTVLAHGDVTGRWQTTDSHEWCVGELRKQFRVHRHYLIVLKVGGPLSKFRITEELVTALRDALQAHTEAYRKGILHRDISIGNILISENGGGLLIDWEFSKPIANPEVRVMARTGTWQFMSAHPLLNPSGAVEHALVDGLESFFHVLCYVILVHCQHKFPKQLLKSHLKSVYDAWFLEEDNEEDNEDNEDNEDGKEGEVVGGYAKRRALANCFMAEEPRLPHDPLRDLVIALEDVIGVRYKMPPTQKARTIYEGLRAKYDMTDEELEEQPVWRYDETMRKLNESSQWMLDTFNKALEDPRGLKAKPVRRKFLSTNCKRIRKTLKARSNRGSTNQGDSGQAGGSGSKRKRTDVHGLGSKKARKGGC
ncbi:other 1 protein kinase [Moniliophthora roreri MCA 2997]|uniref:Other 1 protein kinase n=2 Tax=Moniliophthora roreri TaxID=221103 RepID=V2WP27_MONRO|nr:other 1 protein kinase [Moniliophthora roreri MCA 2997]KAI3621472.1 other 1 protein kinase [Moniliophthora roreri]